MAASEEISRIGQDLLNLEINTIIKPNMTGRKMPEPRRTLIDIAKKYNRDLGDPLKKCHRGGMCSFKLLREAADDKIDALTDKETLNPEEHTELVKLYRIRGMSDELKAMFYALKIKAGQGDVDEASDCPAGEIDSCNCAAKGCDFTAEERLRAKWDNDFCHQQLNCEEFPPLALSFDQLILIRKAWELGTDEIALQTVVQLDGDVVTRIQSKYASGDNRFLHTLHNGNVEVSIKYWNILITVLTDFVKGALDNFFKTPSTPK